MIKRFTTLVGALMAVAWLASAASAGDGAPGRPITPQDITGLEAFGRAAISPDGRWAVYEKRGPYDTAPRFDLASRNVWTIMDLWLVDLEARSPAPVRLLENQGLGLQRLSWSPDSRRLLITRLQGETYEFGLVSMDDRSVRWTGLTPENSRSGATAEWVSADEVLLSIRPDRTLPAILRYDSGTPARMAGNWRRTAEGRAPSRQVIDARDGRVTTEVATPPGALVVLDVRELGVRTLFEGPVSDFAASPDGRRVAVVSGDGPISISDGPIVQQESGDHQHLSLVDFATGAIVRPAPGRDIAETLLRWSPDSRALLVWARADGEAWTDGQLLKIGPEGPVAMRLGDLTPGDGNQIVSNLRADWIGADPVLFAAGGDGGRYDWHRLSADAAPLNLTRAMTSAPARLAAAAPDALWAVAGGSVWRLTGRGAERLGPVADGLEAATPGDSALVRRLALEAPRRDWIAVTGADGASLVVSRGSETRRLGGGGAARSRILAVSDRAALVLERTGLEETLRLRRAGGAERLDAVNSGKRDVRLIEPVAVRHAGVRGGEVVDWLYLPTHLDPADWRGLIVQVYPGQTEGFVWHDPDTQTYGIRSTVLAAAGFAVLAPATPAGTPAAERGEEYVRAVDLAVDAALAAHPELPGDRIGVFGHSFGGYMALEIAGRTRRYQSYVGSAGIYDMIGYWGEVHPPTRAQPEDGMLYRFTQGWVETRQAALGVPPWAAPDAYLASSPFMRVERITAPVMLMTADLDFVPMTQAEMMFSALYRAGKRARMVTYWGEKHNAWSPANIRDRYQLIFDWFDETLGGKGGAVSPAAAGAPTPAPRTRRPPPP